MIGVFPPPLDRSKQSSSQFLVGSQIAGRECVRAMLTYLPQQSVVLLASRLNVLSVTRDLAQMEAIGTAEPSLAQVWPIETLDGSSHHQPLSVIHDIHNGCLHHATYARSLVSSRPFPVTSLVHGFSYSQARWNDFSHLLHTPMLACDSIICTSTAAHDAFDNILTRVQESIECMGGQVINQSPRTDIIPLGVDTEMFQPRDKNQARELLNLPKGKIILLYFGRIDHVSKGDLGPLLSAFRDLMDQHGNKIALVLAGNAGSDQAVDYLETLIAQHNCVNQVFLRLRPSVAEGPLYYSAADIFVSPVETLQESFGLSPLEAMASGLPVVVADWSGYRDTVVHEETGFKVATYWMECDSDISQWSPLRAWEEDHIQLAQSVAVDMDELKHWLNLLIANPERRKAMGLAARARMIEKYDWKHIIASLQDLWQELAEIAQSLPPIKPACQAIEQAGYFRDFGHFASHHFTGQERIELTQRGQQVCRKPELLVIPPLMENWLDTNGLLFTFNLIKTSSLLRSKPILLEVCEKLSKAQHLTVPVAQRSVMWLIKYGYLRVLTR